MTKRQCLRALVFLLIMVVCSVLGYGFRRQTARRIANISSRRSEYADHRPLVAAASSSSPTVRLFSSTSTSSSSASPEPQGTLTVRLFPKPSVVQEYQKHYESIATSSRRIHDIEPLIAQLKERNETELKDTKAKMVNTALSQINLDDVHGTSLIMDVSFHNNNDDVVHMIRDGQEAADKALKRLTRKMMETMTPVQLHAGNKQNQKKKKKKKIPKKGAAKVNKRSTRHTPAIMPTVYMNGDGQPEKVLDVKDHPSSTHLWINLCSAPSSSADAEQYRTLRLQFPERSQLQGKDGQSPLELKVKAHPIFISSVQVVSEHTYVGVPLAVKAKTFPPLSSEDQSAGTSSPKMTLAWFIDGKLVQEGPADFYVPTSDDVGKKIQLLVVPPGLDDDLLEAYEFEHAVKELPHMPVLDDVRKEWDGSNREDDDSIFRVMSYNLLADQYTKQQRLDPPIDQVILDRGRRVPLLVHEMLHYQPDIICLQEVDASIYDEYYETTMLSQGYKGYYTGKREQPEGAAIFWNTDAFEEEVETIGIPINTLIPEIFGRDVQQLLKDFPQLSSKLKALGHVVQVTTLTPKHNNSSKRRIVVANLHLLSHSTGDHVRLLQLHAVLTKLFQDSVPKNSELILCGDFNSDPPSGAVQLLEKKHVKGDDESNVWENLFTFPERRPLSRIERRAMGIYRHDEEDTVDEETYEPPTIGMTPLARPLTSVFGDKPPSFTHSMMGKGITLDYVYTTDGLEVVATAPCPEESFGQLPTEGVPSDHISLVSDVKFKAN